MIYVGVPSHEAAAFGRGYWRTPDEMATIYNVSSPGIGCSSYHNGEFKQASARRFHK